MHRSGPGSAAPPENTASCPCSAPAQQRGRSQGGGSWCCRGCRRGGGDTQSRPSSRASCDRPSRVQTPGPHPTPGQESREEPAHLKTGAKVRRKLPLTSPGGHPWSRPWGFWTHPQLPISTAGVGHKNTCPRGRAWPGLLPLQRAVCRPGPARGRRARGVHRALGCIGAGGAAPPGHCAALRTAGPTLLRGGPERALFGGQQVGMTQASTGSCPEQSYPPGPHGQALAAPPTACGQDRSELLGSRGPRAGAPRSRGLTLPGRRPAS